MFRFIRLFMQLMNNERVIERLAESRPIRRAAQIAASLLIRAKQIQFTQMKEQGPFAPLRDFIARFKQELKQAKDEFKKQVK